MATQAPLSVAEAETSIVALQAQLRDRASLDRAATPQLLREVHDVLMRITPSVSSPPLSCLDRARTAIEGVPTNAGDALPPRQRTVLRLLRAGVLDAAWEVVAENAVGVVAVDFDDSTATGVARTAWRLPLITRVEAGVVYAELPGFRDPRFAAPDECYDLTSSIRLHAGLDSIELDDAAVRLGGWAAYDVLTAGPGERVRVLAHSEGDEVITTGERVRRPDFVGGRGDGLHRRVWAGWAARVDLSPTGLRDGTWALSVQIDHDGLVRRTALGRHASDFARAVAGTAAEIGGRQISWHTDPDGWRLVVRSG